MKKVGLALLAVSLFVSGGLVHANLSEFTDQGSFDSWYKDEVAEMNRRGIIKGYADGSFGPNNNVTRAEVAVMLNRLVEDDSSFRKVVAYNYYLDRLMDRGIDFIDANSIAKAAAGIDLQDEKPNGIDNCEVLDLDISSLYTVYKCAYSTVVHIEGAFSGPFGAEKVTIDKWYAPVVGEFSPSYPNPLDK